MVKAIVEESAGMNPRIAEGSYIGRLAGVVEKILDVKEYDTAGKITKEEQVPRWEWVLAVRTDNKDITKDMRFTVLTSQKISSKSKAFTFVKALEGGQAPGFGVDFDTDNVVGNYATLTIKDKTPKKADRTGAINISSEITDMLPCKDEPNPEISIEGLINEDEPEDAPPEKTAAEIAAEEAAAKAAALKASQAKTTKKK